MTKADIINQIKRTTAENGGVPLGWRKFATETGIRDPDWKGKFWARWSEALREAGYAPNEMTKGHGESALLGKYAKLSLEMGCLPAVADIRLQMRRGLEFPDWNTFTRANSKITLRRERARWYELSRHKEVLRWLRTRWI